MGRHRLPTIWFIILLLAPNIAAAAQPLTPGGLFVPVAVGGEVEASDRLPEAESRWLLREGRGSESMPDEELRSRAVRVDLARLAAARDEVALGRDSHLRLNLFEDIDFRAVIERTAKTRYGYSLSGRINGGPHGTVTLVVHGEILAGAVHSRSGTYVIASRNGAIHTVQETTVDFKLADDLGIAGDAAAGRALDQFSQVADPTGQPGLAGILKGGEHRHVIGRVAGSGECRDGFKDQPVLPVGEVARRKPVRRVRLDGRFKHQAAEYGLLGGRRAGVVFGFKHRKLHRTVPKLSGDRNAD